MKSDEIDYKIFGDDMQYVEVELDPNETVIGEAGSMMYMHEGIEYETKLGDGSNPQKGFLDQLVEVGKRAISQESIFLTHYSNHSHEKSQVAFAAPYPGKIIPLNLAKLKGEVICQKDAFLCAAKGSSISVEFSKKLGRGFFGGEGFILQKIEGDGHAFIHACGGICLKKISNETLRVDTGSIVAFTQGVQYDIEMVSGMKSMLFGGEGLFLATLSGTGYVWLQSMPFSKLADKVLMASRLPSGNSDM